jgi:hypothetical protein
MPEGLAPTPKVINSAAVSTLESAFNGNKRTIKRPKINFFIRTSLYFNFLLVT